jgi:Activator of Hsp90 ATPase homolog 1-like protein
MPAQRSCRQGRARVEIRLTAERGGTRVDLEHRDLPDGQHPGHASGWTHYLARLAAAGGGGDPGPDPGMPDPS